MTNIVKIKALKYPDILHYEWEGELLQQTTEYVIVLCKPGRKLIHNTKNKIFTIDNTSIEYFSLKEWFTAAFAIEDGKVVEAYCNVAMPSIIKNNQLSFIDLDLDYFLEKNKDWVVLDEDEFESNSIKYNYPHELKNQAINALERLKEAVRSGDFPFDEGIALKL